MARAAVAMPFSQSMSVPYISKDSAFILFQWIDEDMLNRMELAALLWILVSVNQFKVVEHQRVFKVFEQDVFMITIAPFYIAQK